jgi:hypothetical protein
MFLRERERERENEAKGDYRRICGVVWCGVRVMVWEYQVFGIWGYHIYLMIKHDIQELNKHDLSLPIFISYNSILYSPVIISLIKNNLSILVKLSNLRHVLLLLGVITTVLIK